MTPLELFEDSRLDDALAAQRAVVAATPDSIADRLLLGDFLAYAGDWSAVDALMIALANGPEAIRGYVKEYRSLIAAERRRREGGKPTFLIPPGKHARLRLDGEVDDADELAPEASGFLDGRPFDGFRDVDDSLGPIIEVLHGDSFAWVPIDDVRTLRLHEAQSMRDNLFRPATLILRDGGEHEIHLPALYATPTDDPDLQLGVGSDWIDSDGLVRGVGAKMWQVGEEELTLSDFSQIEIRN